MIIDKTNLTWVQMSSGDNYISAENNPIWASNVGNTDINVITVKAYNLQGPLGWIIGAGNFTAKNDTGCGGNTLANNIPVVIENAKASRMTKGVSSQPIYYCITNVPDVIPGSYNTIQNWVTTAEG
jgi:hypothetical protein